MRTSRLLDKTNLKKKLKRTKHFELYHQNKRKVVKSFVQILNLLKNYLHKRWVVIDGKNLVKSILEKMFLYNIGGLTYCCLSRLIVRKFFHE